MDDPNLTAGTVVVGAIVILFDPIFQGLAISLMSGAIASTVLTLVAVPVVFYLVERGRQPAEEQQEAAAEPQGGARQLFDRHPVTEVPIDREAPLADFYSQDELRELLEAAGP